MKKGILALLFALMSAMLPTLSIPFSTALRAQSKYGTTAAPFLGIGMGARAIGMGGAYVATADDITALYWNPAGIAGSGSSKIRMGFTNTQWLVGTTINWAGITIPAGNFGVIGIAVTALNYGTFEVTTTDVPEGTGETFDASDLSVQVTFAKRLTDKFAIGGSVKLIRQAIFTTSAQAAALDLGVLFNTGLLPNGLKLGMSISNFGTAMQLDGRGLVINYQQNPNESGTNANTPAYLGTEVRQLPLIFRVGLAYDAVKNDQSRLSIGADALSPTDNMNALNLGGEYSWRETVFIRAGYNALFQTDSETGLTVGAGINYRLSRIGFKFDYTYQTFGRLNAPQWFTLGLEF